MRAINERTATLADIIKESARATSFELRVAIPGIVREWDEQQQTVSVQPAIREKLSNAGQQYEVEIPLLVDVPVVMPRAGGYMLAFAPKPGDECLVIFADSCIDSWWQSGNVQSQAESRRHDLSDGFAILGCWSQPNKPKLPSTGVRLQNDSGTAGISISGNTVNLFGTVQINGKAYTSHTHYVSDTGTNTSGVS